MVNSTPLQYTVPTGFKCGQTNIVKENLIYQFIIRNKLESRGIGWVDVNLLASAILEKHLVYTFDRNLSDVCRDFNCLHLSHYA